MQKETSLTIPLAIVAAGIIVGGAIFFSRAPNEIAKNTESDTGTQEASAALGVLRPVSEQDHIRGNPNADILIVEFSDTECPFCKDFHPVLKQIIDEYGKQGKVAWVYRHFPILSRHPRAQKEAEATECAASQGGNTAFWNYLDRLFEITPTNNGLDPAELPKIAEFVGLDVKKFNECLSLGTYKEKIVADYNEAISVKAQGTPHSIVIAKDGKQYPIYGAQPYETVKSMLDALLAEQP